MISEQSRSQSSSAAKCSAGCLGELPPELLYEVFDLCCNEALLNAKLVSWSWHHLAKRVAANRSRQLFHEGVLLGKHYQLSSSIECLTTSIQLNPTAQAFTELAAVYHRMNDKEAAIKHWKTALRFDGLDRVQCHLIMSQLLDTSGKYEEALEAINEALAEEPDNAQARFERAYVLLSPSLCEPEKAMEDLTKAIENEFDRPFAAYNNRGYAHQLLQDQNGAIADYTRAIECNSKYVPAYVNRAKIYRSTGNYEKAMNDLNCALDICPMATTYCDRGDLKRTLGDLQGGLKDYQSAKEVCPSYTYAYRIQAAIMADHGDISGAIDELSTVIELVADAYTLSFRGQLHREMQAYRLALEDLSRAVELLPADTEIFECFVNTLEELIEHGNEDASDCILRAANSFRPNSANHYRSRGELFIKLGDSGRALEDFEQALHLDPTCSHVYEIRASVYRQQGNLQKALNEINQAMQLARVYQTDILRTRAELHLELKMYENAIEDFQQLLQIDPNDPTSSDGLNMAMKRLRNQRKCFFIMKRK